jgi:hypothetical protein
MFEQTCDPEALYRAVDKFSALGTGRNRRKVLIGDSQDARTAKLLAVGNIYQNLPSQKIIKIKTDSNIIAYDISSKTVFGKPAYIFHWNHLTADLWSLQMEREKFWHQYDKANKKDQLAMAELVGEEANVNAVVLSFLDGLSAG